MRTDSVPHLRDHNWLGNLVNWDGELMALARMDYHVALTTIADFTRHAKIEEPMSHPLLHLISDPIKCRLQLRTYA